MGDNYRASNTGLTANEQETVKNIKAGTTPAQRRRAFMDKLIVGGAMAGLTGAAGLASASHSYTTEMDKKRGVMKDAISRATMADAIGRATKEDQFNRTFNPGSQPSGNVPAWLGEHGEGADGHRFQESAPEAAREPVDMSLPADRAKANQKLNASASMASLGGYRTKDGSDEHAAGAESLTRDIATAKQGMREAAQMGGMSNSLVRNPTPDMRAAPDAYHDPTDDYFGTRGGR